MNQDGMGDKKSSIGVLKNGLPGVLEKVFDYSSSKSALYSTVTSVNRRGNTNNNSRRVGKSMKVEDGIPQCHSQYASELNSKYSTDAKYNALSLTGIPSDMPPLENMKALRKKKSESSHLSERSLDISSVIYNNPSTCLTYNPYDTSAYPMDYTGTLGCSYGKGYSNYPLASQTSYHPLHDYIMTSSSPNTIPTAYHTSSSYYNTKLPPPYIGSGASSYFPPFATGSSGGYRFCDYPYSVPNGGLPSPEMSPSFDGASTYHQETIRSSMTTVSTADMSYSDPTSSYQCCIEQLPYENTDSHYNSSQIQKQEKESLNNLQHMDASSYVIDSPSRCNVYSVLPHNIRDSSYYSASHSANLCEMMNKTGTVNQPTPATPDSLQHSPSNYPVDWKSKMADIAYSSCDGQSHLHAAASNTGQVTGYESAPTNVQHFFGAGASKAAIHDQPTCYVRDSRESTKSNEMFSNVSATFANVPTTQANDFDTFPTSQERHTRFPLKMKKDFPRNDVDEIFYSSSSTVPNASEHLETTP